MEYDQRVIIKFPLNERANACDIADRIQAQFVEHASQLRTIRFWIAEARLSRQGLHDEMCIRKPPLDDFDAKILAI
jgi:hypothetical protein